jgi:UDP-2,3-diacylglucosamine hydrolase
MTTLFISDLHLDETHPHITALFLQFLQNQAVKAEALYILGDLFEVWVGDDDRSTLSTTVCGALQSVSQTGTAIYLMHGNRDFLLGQHFAQACGASLLPEPAVINLYGTPTLLLHGDTLCTADTRYQAFRQQVRNPTYQQQFLQQSLQERKTIAKHLRQASSEHQQAVDGLLLDITPSEIPKIMQQYQLTQLIHGHTHRPAIHYFQLGNQLAKHFVLSDWETEGNALVCTPDYCRLIYFQ